MAVRFERTGMLLIISGPSGTGKGTLVKKLMDSDPSFRFSWQRDYAQAPR